MAIDYATIAARAAVAVGDAGRTVTIGRTAETPADPAEPWDLQGATGATSFQAPVALFGYSLKDVDGETVKAGDQWGILAADDVPGGVDPAEYDVLTDDTGEAWRIVSVEPLRPGPTALLYTLRLRRT